MKIIHMSKFGPGKVAKTICLPVGVEPMPVGYKCTVLANKLQGVHLGWYRTRIAGGQ